tara:strand:- start:1453 stop:1869 length:417 start_codon:yes stop_codon:yes gene_type:complete
MKKINKIINELLSTKECINILEVGCGEGNALRCLKKLINENDLKRVNFFGLELSFSRTKICKKYFNNSIMVVGDMNNLPFDDNSFDIVFTSGAIEPNRDQEEVILKELYRVSNDYIILNEISYREANDKLKDLMNINI